MRNIKKKSIAALLTLLLTALLAFEAAAAKKSPVGVKGGWLPANADGTLLSYVLPDGSVLRDGFTSDGYYVSEYGVWAPSIRILSAWLPSRNSWLTAAEARDLSGFVPFMSSAQAKLTEDLHGFRVISVYSNRITLSSIANQEGKRSKNTRLALYKNDSTNGYTIQLATELSGDVKEMPNGGGGEWGTMAFYDYQVLRLLTNCISRSGDMLATAIYDSWQDDNAYGIKLNQWVTVGDTMVKYIPSDGAGLYEIKAAF